MNGLKLFCVDSYFLQCSLDFSFWAMHTCSMSACGNTQLKTQYPHALAQWMFVKIPKMASEYCLWAHKWGRWILLGMQKQCWMSPLVKGICCQFPSGTGSVNFSQFICNGRVQNVWISMFPLVVFSRYLLWEFPSVRSTCSSSTQLAFCLVIGRSCFSVFIERVIYLLAILGTCYSHSN